MSVTHAWVDGARIQKWDSALPLSSRGLHYGDGLFETMLLRAGRIRFLDAHLARLRIGCERLGIAIPDDASLKRELDLVVNDQQAIVKLLFFRGGEGRGYQPSARAEAVRIMLLYQWTSAAEELRVRWCETRLGRNAALAGMKHLNRLEQVLAQTELAGSGCDEGLLLDSEGNVVSAIAGNLFIVRDGELHTPELFHCGVRGVMRAQVLRLAQTLGIIAHERRLAPGDIDLADEIFITNAIRGVRAVVQVNTRKLSCGPVTRRLQQDIADL